MKWLLVASLFFLTNCSAIVILPPIIEYSTLGVSVASYVFTGKGTSDHIMSAIVEKDCALHRAISEEEICIEFPEDMTLDKYVELQVTAIQDGGILE